MDDATKRILIAPSLHYGDTVRVTVQGKPSTLNVGVPVDATEAEVGALEGAGIAFEDAEHEAVVAVNSEHGGTEVGSLDDAAGADTGTDAMDASTHTDAAA